MRQTFSGLSARRQGLTLIELVLAMAISAIILFVVAVAYVASIRTFTQEISRSDIFWDGYRGLDTITEELRDSLEIIANETDNISFWWKDLNANNSIEANEVVSYSLSGQNLIRSVGGEDLPLVQNVVGFDLAYDYPANPGLITITLTLRKEGQMTTLESKVNPR
jgi:prepilin-type N-terminal cleavage/methylation domain-containing protein